MNSILKRYIFKSGLDVVAPLKCGTRWLEGLDVDTRMHRITFNISELSSHIHGGTTFIWRGVREHMLSALKTELSTHSEKSPFDVVTEMEVGICDHWYPHLYRELYTIWEKTPFRFHKLRALSEIAPNVSGMEYISKSYNFALPNEWSSVKKIMSSLSSEHLIKIEKLITEEEKWLKLMIEPYYSGKNWEAYSDLEDSRLELMCKVMDMEAEVSRVTNEMNIFQTTIKELEKSNTKLEAKIDYAEQIIGKLPAKLI